MRYLVYALLLLGIIFYVCPIAVLFSKYPYVQRSTEQKYLRNLHRYRPIAEDHFHVGMNDSLGYIVKVSFAWSPFHEWRIEKTGAIRPNSQLSQALDSMSKLWVEPENKFK